MQIVEQVEHIGLAARDPALLKDWYVRVLGAVPVCDNGAQPPAFLVQLPGGLLLEIYPAMASPAGNDDNSLGGWRHLALRVESIERAREQLDQQQVPWKSPVKPAGWGGRVLFFSDPENNLLHLVERPADAAFFTFLPS